MNHPRPAALLWTRQVARDVFHQRFAEPYIARHARAGQFVHLLPGTRHLFRRALSVYATDAKAGTFDVLHQVLGEGTRCLSQLKKGQTVDALGPLGNQFLVPDPGRRAILVGGGLGMAPLRLFALELNQKLTKRSSRRTALERTPILLLGTRTSSLAIAPFELGGIGIRASWASDDGSRGFHGTVVALLADQIADGRIVPEQSVVYGCGPEPMMAGLASLCAQHHLPCWVSLERSMPCGYGVCMGCVIRTQNGTGYETFKRVCRDGPVFDSAQIVF
ncbi:MAG: dihydroorotate dehydrogenase electron transfer subunit [candidate division Zixibacteria bacterium]|nr:dihydroorotate dehydrogenase electron transfer subunit [candidate division Zixibacteria bacterium]